MLRACLLALALAGLGFSSAEAQQRRVALVVGISEYQDLPRIVRPAGDARAVAARLQDLGVEANLLADPDEGALAAGLERLVSSLGQGDVALLYFAGHATRQWDDFILLPADAPADRTRQEDIRRLRRYGVSSLADQIRATGARAQVFVIDACRGDPYATDGRDAPSSCGEVGQQLPEGTFALFSASAGQKALDRLGDDDRDPHSLFTRTLLARLPEVRSVVRLARQVREEVVQLAAAVSYQQRPAYLDELVGPPVLLQPRERDTAAPAPPAPPRETVIVTPPAPEPRPAPRPQPPREAFQCGARMPGPPAFDCRSARRAAEVAICRDPGLGSCDQVLTDLFERAEARSGRGAARLRREEDAWLARRDACGTLAASDADLVACIGRAYDERIAELDQAYAGRIADAVPSFDCRFARTSVEQAICADPALAARDREMAALFARARANGAGRAYDVEGSQRDWLMARDACARGRQPLEPCLAALYDRRIRDLGSLASR